MKNRPILAATIFSLVLVYGSGSQIAFAAVNRTLTLEAEGLKSFRIDAGAGDLRIEGTPSGNRIEVVAEIVGDERNADLRLEKHGSTAELRSHAADWLNWIFGQTRIHLKVKVPSGLSLDIEDGSGDLTLHDVTANARIDDGSGALEIRNHRGNIVLHDGSGSITIDGVTGDVDIRDGSGSMSVLNVDGHVTIDDGSGSITVRNVKKGLTILDAGSGGIVTQNVEGAVDRRE